MVSGKAAVTIDDGSEQGQVVRYDILRPVLSCATFIAVMLGLALVTSGAHAAPWQFSAPLTLAGATGEPHYHHLDGAGRRHVAADTNHVAIVWEDDRSGAPQVYFASKGHRATGFAESIRLSTGAEAYEPAIAGLGAGHWLAAWEQFRLPVHRPAAPANVAEMPALQVVESSDRITVSGSGFSVGIDRSTGLLSYFEVEGRELLVSPLEPDFWRAPTDNDYGNRMPRRQAVWKDAGRVRTLEGLETKAIGAGQVKIDAMLGSDG